MAFLLTEVCTAGWHALMTLLSIHELEALASESAGSLPLLRRIELADVVANHLSDVEDGQQKSNRIIDTLLDTSEHNAWQACHIEHLNETAFSTPDADFVRVSLHEIAASAKSESLSIRATFRLVNCDEDVSSHLPRLLHSQEAKIRVDALKLLAKQGDAEFRMQLRDAFGDQDYRCRREAMTLLANNATSEEKASILALADDRSAPVREICAHIIQEQEWNDAQPVLLKLLKDRRSAEHGVGLFNGQIHNFHVARAAAMALAFTDNVHVSTAQAVKRFLELRNPDKDDPIVHYYALQFLARFQGIDVSSMLILFLSDDWYVPGMKHDGFPLRFAAAWGLLAQLQNDRSFVDSTSTDAIFDAARHHDPRLAGPSLLCLTLCGRRAIGQVIQLCTSSTFTKNRMALLRIALATADLNCPRELLDQLADHPVEEIILFSKSLSVDEATWISYCEENQAVGEWVSSIQSSGDVNSTLRLAIHELFGRRIEGHLSYDDIRANELPESLPVMNLRSMTGGE